MNGGSLPPRPTGRGMINSRPDIPPTPPRRVPAEPQPAVQPQPTVAPSAIPSTPQPTLILKPQPIHSPTKPTITEEPKIVHHTQTTRHTDDDEKKSKRRFLLPAIIALVVIIIGVLCFIGVSSLMAPKTAVTSGIETSKFQAVFFNNGQVYFGKLQVLDTDTYKLTDIFYLQTPETDTTTTTTKTATADSSTAQLIKLGQEVYGPEDAMIIQKSQVQYYENLKSDGKVSQLIVNYQKSH